VKQTVHLVVVYPAEKVVEIKLKPGRHTFIYDWSGKAYSYGTERTFFPNGIFDF
jgi:hypothetical protein